MDTLTRAQRSERMGRVHSKNTKPEMAVRRLVHSLGFRFRLHRRDLPGNPDLAFPGRRKLIFVHGCFWHRHGSRCPLTRLPKSRLDFWIPKLEQNQKRDQKNRRLLRAAGWGTLVIWECQLKDNRALAKRICNFLESNI
ncbi:MAG TPA: DNA mismatch endonuclease Vsr [Bryobacteraceae bacterium]